MKSLILLLFVAISVQAQSLPEAARKERERQANQKPKVVFTGEKARETTPATVEQPAAATPAPTTPAAKSVEAAKPAPATPAKAPASKPSDDAAKKYAEEI